MNAIKILLLVCLVCTLMVYVRCDEAETTAPAETSAPASDQPPPGWVIGGYPPQNRNYSSQNYHIIPEEPTESPPPAADTASPEVAPSETTSVAPAPSVEATSVAEPSYEDIVSSTETSSEIPPYQPPQAWGDNFFKYRGNFNYYTPAVDQERIIKSQE